MAQYFIGVGGQKCGTSWLGDHLYRHPQVLRHSIKEMHVFDSLSFEGTRAFRTAKVQELIARLEQQLAEASAEGTGGGVARFERWLRDRRDQLAILQAPHLDDALERYERYFTERVGPRHRCFGEITPGYALLPAAGFEAVLSVYSDARFVFLMRDPVDRLWSALRHRYRAHPHLDPIERFEDALLRPAIVKRTAYEETLTTLDAAVPPGQVLVLFYEDLFSVADTTVLRSISDFLGIDHVEGDRATRQNEGESAELPAELRRRAVAAFADLPVRPRPVRSPPGPVARAPGRGRRFRLKVSPRGGRRRARRSPRGGPGPRRGCRTRRDRGGGRTAPARPSGTGCTANCPAARSGCPPARS